MNVETQVECMNEPDFYYMPSFYPFSSVGSFAVSDTPSDVCSVYLLACALTHNQVDAIFATDLRINLIHISSYACRSSRSSSSMAYVNDVLFWVSQWASEWVMGKQSIYLMRMFRNYNRFLCFHIVDVIQYYIYCLVLTLPKMPCQLPLPLLLLLLGKWVIRMYCCWLTEIHCWTATILNA